MREEDRLGGEHVDARTRRARVAVAAQAIGTRRVERHEENVRSIEPAAARAREARAKERRDAELQELAS